MLNNFDNVFLAIKKYNSDDNFDVNENCFEIIARSANIPLKKLNFYLSALKDFGLIEYSWDDSFVHLTLFGRNQNRLSA